MLLSILLINLLFVIARAGVPYLTKQPSYVPPCRIKSPDFVKCSTRSAQKLFSEISAKGGLPGLDSIPPIDPLRVNKIRVTQGGDNALNIKLDLSKVLASGFGKIKVIESRVSSKDYSWVTKLSVPKMTIVGDYVLKGRILLIPLNGKGKMTFQIDNPKIEMHTKTRLYEKEGFTFYNVTDGDCDYTIKKLSVNFENLFNGNKELEDSTNAFFNQNWQILNDSLKPVLAQTIADIFLGYLQSIFHAIPANFFVTDIPTPKELYGE